MTDNEHSAEEPDRFDLAVVSNDTVFLVKHIYTGKEEILEVYTDILARKIDESI